MHIAYYDEAGDDGFPKYSSPLFVLSCIYFHYLNWRPIFDTILNFRREIKSRYNIPVRMEMHTRDFLLNKKPYGSLRLSEQNRIEIVGLFCDLAANLDLKVINVVIVKPKIKKQDYQILDTAVKYSVQRIENDLNPKNDPSQRFMLITDPGRVGKMTQTTRRIQRINFIPSKFGPATYRKEIATLIEDPLPKNSDQSFFIQLADLISYVVYLYSSNATGIAGYPNRMGYFVSPETVAGWMERLKPSLNLQASGQNAYGVVFHPK
jgi:hypothetical protein